MSGDSEAPPTYYFSGITFNPDFYQSTTGNYLTQTTAKNYFLTYPSAQGTETITTLNSSSINSSSESSDLSIVPSQTSGILNIGTNSTTVTRTTGAINIGSNVVGTTPITIGMSGKSTTALNGTVTVGSSMTTNGISNTGTISSSGSISTTGTATITSAGSITGTSLVLGTGAIGCGAITSTGNISTSSASGTITAPSGGFLIGPYKNAATSSASITAAGVITGTKLVTPTIDCASSGTSLYLGSNLDTGNIFLGSVISTGNITIGRESGNHTGVITIGGSQTTGVMEIATKSTRTGAVFFCSTTGQTNSIYIGATGTKTILDGEVSILKALTLPVVSTSPTSTQLGYFASSNNATEITVSATNSTPATVTNLPIGIYLFSYSIISYTPTIGASQVMTYSVTTTGGATSSIASYVFNGVATTFQDTQNLVGVVKATTALNSVVLNLIITSGGGTIKASQYGYNYIKIA